MNKHYFLLIAILHFALVAHSQNFFKRADFILADEDTYSGVSLATADMNGDYIDDIIFTDGSRSIVIAYQNVNGEAYEMRRVFVTSDRIWSMAAGDVNNDGLNDLLVCNTSNCDLLINDQTSFIQQDLNVFHFSQASNMIDYNSDGVLDLFICNDDGPNKLFLAEEGNYVLTDVFDDTDGGTNDGSGNYGSTWTDIDRDGDMDLHIAKCRGGAMSSSDPRRINRLYINDGGVMTESAESYGLNIGDQTWAADFGDIDNDGDLDLYLVNHEAPNRLFINEEGGYVDRSDWLGDFNNGFGIQCLMVDINNDTYLDIMVTGTKNFIHINQGGTGFLLEEQSLAGNAAESFSWGDFNQDGYLDIAAGYARLFTTPSTKKDLIWLNNGGDNNYFKINLIGRQSNMNGIGAMVELHGPWGVQLREVRSGESYGISRTLSQYFGLGSHDAIDSVRILWPSGIVDVLHSPQINSYYIAKEDNCISPLEIIKVNGWQKLCGEEDITITTDNEENVQWNTGSFNHQLIIDQPSTVWANVSDDMSCDVKVVPAHRFVNFVADNKIFVRPRSSSCEGEIVTLEAPEGTEYRWEDNSQDRIREILTSGLFTVSYKDICGEDQTAMTDVQFQSSDVLVGVHDTISISGPATPSAVGDSVIWFEDPQGLIELGRGDTLNMIARDDTTVYASNGQIGVYDRASIVEFNTPEGEPAQQLNAKIFFDVKASTVIESIDVEAVSEGIRKIQIFNAEGILFFEREYDLEIGLNTIVFDLFIPESNGYYLTTDEDTNISVQGDVSPRLMFYHLDSHLPIMDDARVSVTNTSLGSDYYFYFINWKIYSESFCLSDPVPVSVEVEVVSDTDNLIPNNEIDVYPNPASSILNINFKSTLNLMEMTCHNALGQEVLHLSNMNTGKSYQIDVNSWSSGIYLIHIKDDRGRRYVHKMIR